MASTQIETTDQCPTGDPHLFIWVPAGIETGLHFPALLCDECGAAAPEIEVVFPDGDCS